MGQSKDTERTTAKILFVEQYKSAKDIARQINVSEKTVGNWIEKYNWKSERDARMNSNKKQVQRIREVISIKCERAIALENQINDAVKKNDIELIDCLKQQAISLGDEVSKWNKTLENLDKENRISLSVYIDVMDSVFKSLQKDYPKLYLQTLDFQDKHINEISLKYG
jgi:hypothetical protein